MDKKISGKLHKSQRDQALVDQNIGYQLGSHLSTLVEIFESFSSNDDGEQRNDGQRRTKRTGSKDIAPRLLIKFLDYLLKMKKIQKRDYDQLRAKRGNLRLLEQFFQNMTFRPLIAQYFISRQFKKDVLTSKKRLNLKDQRATNSLKNLLKLETFITFCFIQGSIKNLASLEKPIFDENSLYQNRTNFSQLYQVPNPQPLDFHLESPQLQVDNGLDFHDSEDELWNCLERNNESHTQHNKFQKMNHLLQFTFPYKANGVKLLSPSLGE